MPRCGLQKALTATPLGLALTLACLAATPAHAGTDQLWYLGDNGSRPKNANIVNLKDYSCVDARGETAGNGTWVQTWGCKILEDDSEKANAWNQRWRASPNDNSGWCSGSYQYRGSSHDAPNPCVGLWFSIAVGDNWGACVDIPGGNDSNGQPLQIYECNGTPAQVWRSGIPYYGESPFWIRSNITGNGVNRCWTNWERVVLYDCAYDF
jgi:hypothetical protein